MNALGMVVSDEVDVQDERLESVVAPSPAGKDEFVELTVSRERVQRFAKQRKLTKIFELFYNVCGQLPRVNNIGYHERDDASQFPDHWGGLRHAHALFKGLRRPMNHDHEDAEIFVYTLSPRFTYEYVPHMTCVARRVDAPREAVFVVYTKFTKEGKGSVISWEWVQSSGDGSGLPEDFENRYEQRVW